MWTADLPAECGYYWWRYKNEKGNPRIVKINRGLNGLRVTYFGTDLIEILGSVKGVFWSEPILCPDGSKPFLG